MHPHGRDRVIYRLLGELEIGPDGRSLDLPGGSALIVLAVLLVSANRRISKTDLIRAAWGIEDVEEAQLHKRLATVRDLLKQIGRSGDLKTHPRFGYEMRVAEDDLDTLLFRRLVREADEAGAERRAEDEIGRLRRGAGAVARPASAVERARRRVLPGGVALEQRHKRAAVRLFDLELARGRHEQILDELILVTAGYYPADRRLCEQLMIAQYRCGHATDALAPTSGTGIGAGGGAGGRAGPAAAGPALRDRRRGRPAAIAATEERVIAKRAGGPARPGVSVPRQLPRPGRPRRPG